MTSRDFFRLAEDGLATVMDAFAQPPSLSQCVLAKQLTDSLNVLLKDEGKGEGSAFWQGICEELHRLAAAGDPMYFMRWPPIKATMVHGAVPATLRMWWMLRQSPGWRKVWKPALRHPQFGNPPPFALMLSTNAMAIEHASHLMRFHRQQGEFLHDTGCIVEFGGGFGSMCRIIRALGFRGRYIIFDLPPVLALQRYYLRLHEIHASEAAGADVWLCPDLETILDWLVREGPASVSLISTWALSEMPLTIRKRIEPFFRLKASKKALLAFQPSFEGNDNHIYFRDLMTRTADRWSWIEASVDRSGKPASTQDSLYMFGRMRSSFAP